MKFNRRQFLLLTASLASGCHAADQRVAPPARAERLIMAGPASRFAADGVYSDFRELGFFVIRRGDRLFAISAICTHRKCKLAAEPDRSFYCQCHGSTFNPDGHVTRGPASRDLPELSAHTDQHGQLIIHIPAP